MVGRGGSCASGKESARPATWSTTWEGDQEAMGDTLKSRRAARGLSSMNPPKE